MTTHPGHGRCARRIGTVLAAAFAAAACGHPADLGDEGTLVGAPEPADDETGYPTWGISGSIATGTTLEATTGVNLRTGPSTSYRVLRVVPAGGRVTVLKSAPSGNWYNVRYSGTDGWSYGAYYRTVQAAPPANPGGREAALGRARAGVGFSYWWGHGRWLPAGPSSSTRGSCTGSCPSCRHSGSNGADCSGFVGKVWQVPAGNNDLARDSHPYSTWNFYNQRNEWRVIDRGSLQRADALVYHDGSAGHTFIFDGGDAWGSLWSMEARGCVTGIVRNLRTAGREYKAIARY